MKRIAFVFLLVLLSSFTMEAQYPKIYINEILASNKNGLKDDKGKRPDWIELYNPNDFAVLLNGYYLSDDKDSLVKWKLDEEVSIDSRSYKILWACGDETPNGDRGPFKLSSKGERVILTAPDGKTVIDEIAFCRQEPDVSFARNGDANPAWIFCSEPTPGAANSKFNEEFLTPKLAVVNEVQPSNVSTIKDENGEYEDWIEIKSEAKDGDLDLSGCHLTDRLDKPSKWTFPRETVLEPGGFLLVWADDDLSEGLYHASFKLSKKGETVYLLDQVGGLIDSLKYGEVPDDKSFGRSGSGVGILAYPTPGSGNAVEVENGSARHLIKVYPNPFSDFLILENLPSDVDEIAVYDALGRKAASFGKTRARIRRLDLRLLDKGAYFLAVKIGSFCERFIVAKR